jgi:hypothetical protein
VLKLATVGEAGKEYKSRLQNFSISSPQPFEGNNSGDSARRYTSNYTNSSHQKTSLYLDNTLADAPRSQSRQERILDGADEANPVIGFPQSRESGATRTVLERHVII